MIEISQRCNTIERESADIDNLLERTGRVLFPLSKYNTVSGQEVVKGLPVKRHVGPVDIQRV